MSCDIVWEKGAVIAPQLIEAADGFAAALGGQIPGRTFHVRLREPDLQGWEAYIEGQGPYGSELCGMLGSGWYHFEDTYYLSDGEYGILRELVREFADVTAEDGMARELVT